MKEELVLNEPMLISTSGLLLKVYSPEAATAVIKEQEQEVAMKTFGPHKASDFDRFRATVLSSNNYRSCMLFMIYEKGRDEVIGSCNFHVWMKQHRRAEIGYALEEPFRNKGIMKEAMTAVIAYGFDHMQLNRIEAFIGSQNEPSLKLARHFGFTREGVMREHYCKEGRVEDSVCFSLLRREYEEQRNNG